MIVELAKQAAARSKARSGTVQQFEHGNRRNRSPAIPTTSQIRQTLSRTADRGHVDAGGCFVGGTGDFDCLFTYS